jgi:uncharacterized membrane protein required for colicin V production
MILDLSLLVVLLLAFISGFRLGFVVQIVRLGVLVGSYLGARVLYPALAPLERAFLPQLAEPLRDLLAFAAVFLSLYGIASLLVGLAVKRFHDTHPVAGGVDRVLGGLLGLLKSAGVLYLALCFALALAPMLNLRDVEPQIQKSQVAGFVSRHNLLHEQLGVYLNGLNGLAAVINDPDKRAGLMADKELQIYFALEGNTVEDDPKLMRAFEKGDWATLLKDPRILRALQDPHLYQALERLEGSPVKTPGASGSAPANSP